MALHDPTKSRLPFIGIGTQRKRGLKFVYVDYEPPEDAPVRRYAGYREIRAWILQEYGFGVSPYQVAYVKRKNGAVARKCRDGSPTESVKPRSVPPEKEAAIEAVLRHFGMI